MKRYALSFILASTLLAQTAGAQASSSTPVIGYYKFDAPVGNSLWVSGFVTKKEFQGQMTSFTIDTKGTPALDDDETTITQTGAAFPSFGLHYVEMLTASAGVNEGLVLDIKSNTATTITLFGRWPGGANLTYCVRKHATLGTLFAGGAGLVAGQDNVSIYSDTGALSTYAWSGTAWEDAFTGDPADLTIINPGQGVVVTNGGGAPVVLTFGGNDVSYVKSGPTQIPLYSGAPNVIGLINPLVATQPADPLFATAQNVLGSMGFIASLEAGNDLIDVYSVDGNLTVTGTYLSSGTSIEDAFTGDPANSVAVRNGNAVILSVGTTKLHSIPQLHP